MDKMILGLLLLSELTIYEIRNYIQTYFSDMCSNSMGAIQSAIKKLVTNDMIEYTEYVDNGVNKKRYSIKESGKVHFLNWVSQPMNSKKAKNMELSKMYFMGLVVEEKRLDLIQAYIDEQENNLKDLYTFKNSMPDVDKQIEEIIKSNSNNPKHLEQLRSCAGKKTDTECLKDISIFSLATLDYAIQSTEFEISWYEKLKEKLTTGKHYE
ncbi:PadR family transcriptional regulator [Mycoplasmatota bacterium zrk1]